MIGGPVRVIRRRRCARPAEQDAGSLPLALLLTMLVVSFGALVLPVTLDQVGGTRQTVTRGRALHAATTGLEVAVSAVRAAYRTGGGGDRTLLPCGPIEGTAGDGAGATYSVTLTYYDDDPAVAGAGTLICSQETGPVAAKYVRLTATGTTTGGSPSVRRVRGDYPLRVAPPSPSASATPSAT
jgi:hypothetical protein